MFEILRRDRFVPPLPGFWGRLRARLRNLMSRRRVDEHAEPHNWGIG